MTIKNKMKRSGAAIALLGSMAGVGSAMAPSASAKNGLADHMPGNYTIAFCQKSISAASKPCPGWISESYGQAKDDLHRSIMNIQYQLNLHGIHLAVDGVYGPSTRAAVIKAQKYYRIAADGVVGPTTVSALGMRYYSY